jgi:hypothetical protein
MPERRENGTEVVGTTMAKNIIKQRRKHAVEAMAVALAGSGSALAALTCTELDSIVKVVALHGHPRLAAALVLGHASGEDPRNGDEDGDLHQDVTLAFWATPADEVAADYVRDLVSL